MEGCFNPQSSKRVDRHRTLSLSFDVGSHKVFLTMLMPVDITLGVYCQDNLPCVLVVSSLKVQVSAHPHDLGSLGGNTAQAATVALVARNLNDTLTSANVGRLHIQMGPLKVNPI